jgi:RNA polymerase sigma factor (sigma-70 family)
MDNAAISKPSISKQDPEVSNDRDRVLLLFEGHIGIAKFYANQYWYPNSDNEDLFQVAKLALYKAACAFNEDKGPFPPYAAAYIKGELKHYFRDNKSAVHIPRHIIEDALTVNKHFPNFTDYQTIPSQAEIAKALNCAPSHAEDIQLALAARYGINPIDGKNFYTDDENENDNSPINTLFSIENGFEEILIADAIKRLITTFSPTESEIFSLRRKGYSQRKIAKELGFNQMAVSRMLRTMLVKTKEALCIDV